MAQFEVEVSFFEIYNEPHATQFTANNLNAMNEAVLPIIRSHNPTRIVFFGGLKFMNPSWINSNPDALHFPTNDTQLMLEIHSYDPYDYAGGKNPTVHSWGYVCCLCFVVRREVDFCPLTHIRSL